MSQQNYNFWSRSLHRLALGSRIVAETSFDLERALNPADDGDEAVSRPVFVAGLARAGTTILMRQLYRTGVFRSLTYRDMPFVLAPNLWDRFSRLSRTDMEAEVRAHGDGILVDYDSPEALEEVFWRVNCGREYIRPDRLVPMSTDAEAENDFRDYVRLLLKAYPGRRYLSKNNNNVLRLPSLKRCFADAAIVIPFREPKQHAWSLMRQHRLFLERHEADRFSRDYMTWLVHHEFGADHRPFILDEAQFGELQGLDPASALDYWLRIWLNAYRHIADTAPEGTYFISYERLCGDTEAVWAGLCASLGLPPGPPAEALRGSRQDIDLGVSASLEMAAQELYDALRAREAWR